MAVTVGKITENMKLVYAKAVRDAIKNVSSNERFYAFTAYASGDDYTEYSGRPGPDSDMAELLTPDALTEIYNNQLTMHQVLPGGVSRVIPRKNWVFNSIYQPWQSSSTTEDNFYVMSTEVVAGSVRQNVYKCLYAPLATGGGFAPSTVAPTGVLAGPINHGDGYLWSFMYTVPQSDAIKFLTEEWLPVPEQITSIEASDIPVGTTRYDQLTAQNNAQRGTVFNIIKNPLMEDSDFLNIDSDAFGLDTSRTTINVVIKDGLGRPDNLITQTLRGRMVRSSSNSTDWRFELTGNRYGIGYRGQPSVTTNLNISGEDEINLPQFVPQISPDFGHGYNAPDELGALNLMMISRNVPTDGFENLARGTFSMVGLTKNPVDVNTDNVALKNYYTMTHVATMQSVPIEWEVGDRFQLSGQSVYGRVVSRVGNRLWFVMDTPTVQLSNNDQLVNLEAGKPPYLVSQYFGPDIVYGTGDILLIDNKPEAVIRSEDQIESVNIIMKF